MDEQRIVAFINNLISGTKSTFEKLSEKFLINLIKQIIISDYKNNLKFLRNLASEDYLIFLQQLIEIEIDNWNNNRNTTLIYLFLEEHQDKLNLKLAELITQWFNLVTDLDNFKLNDILASLLNIIAIDIKNFPLGSRSNNIEIAITCCQNALIVRTKDAFPHDWAESQNTLGLAYSDRIKGSKTDNIESAITCHQNALTVYTKDTFPERWAITQNNLGSAYSDRIKGSKTDNIESAIASYQNALTVRTKDTFPQDWAGTQNNLAVAYSDRIKGSKTDNIESAIASYQNALTVYTKDAFPQDWAMTQYNLANAYNKRIKGSTADNIESAITCYENALTVRTKDTFPQDWAGTQNNLAAAYSDRIKGSTADNIESAITCYENALTVYTKDALPKKWASTQYNLANAYSDRIKGSKTDNIESAITYYENALTVFTKDAFPEKWAGTQNNLANAYSNRIKGSTADNIESAITCYQNALTVRTKDTLPEKWADTQNNLGLAYSNRIKGSTADNIESAITCYQNALTVRTKDTLPEKWADTQNNLGLAYSNRIKGSTADNIESAITCYENALTVFTKDALPKKWASTQYNLANAYSDRIKGSKTDNIESAITYYENALTVFTKDALPKKWASTQNNLGLAYSDRIKGSRADNLESAITCCQNALTVYTKEAFPQDWAMTQNYLATAYNKRKGSKTDDLESAITCYQNALTVYTKDAFPQGWAMTQNNLGLAYSDRIKGSRADNLESAITSYNNALTVYTRYAFPQNNTGTLNNLGLAYQDQSNYYNDDPTKKQTALENAYNTFKEALDVVEYIRGDITDAEAKTKLNEEWNRLYQGMVQVCLELGKDQEAIEYVDRSKARNLVEQIALSDAYPKGVIPDQDRQRLQELRNLIAEEDRRLQEERRLQQDPNQDSQYINQLRQEYQEKFPYKPVPFNEMQKLLDEKTAILEWYILPGEKILTFIITANSLKLQVFTEEDLDQLGKFGGEYLDAYYSNNNQWYDDLVARMQKLSNILHLPQLLESVFESLPQCEKLILMPHLYLHLFPIHALPVMHNGENKPLQEYFAQGVIYAPNCQLLQQTQKRQYSQFDRLFAIQNPTQDLSGADLELENIRNIFHPDKRSSLQRQYATKTNFLNKDLSQVHHLYFSCHGSSNIDEPLKSGLLLADEVLTLEEIISKLKLNQCSLVTLSACETGQVGIDQTDEYISLASGFILAGATSVLMSLWSVNQVSTAFLLIKTYEYLKEQLEAKQPIQLSIILRDAQNWLRNITIAQLKIWVNNSTLLTDDWRPAIIDYFNGENFVNMLKEHGENYCPYASPFHWAAFCIVGQAELKYFNQENSKMPSDANVIQAFIQLITTNPNDVLNGYWDKLDQLKKGISDDDEKNARSIENWLKQYEKLQQAYNQLLPQNSLQGEGNKIFRVTPSSEESVSLEAMIDQVVKRNTELTENSPQPETTPDTKLDTKTEDSEKPLS